MRLGRRGLPVSRHRGDVSGGRRSARPRPAPLGAGALGAADLAGRSSAVRAGPRESPEAGAHHARRPDRRRRAERHDGSRRVRRVHEPPAPPHGDRPRRGPPAPDRRRLDRGESARPAHRRRAAQRTPLSPDGPRLHGRRRARGDAPPPPAGPPRSRLPHRLWRHARAHARLVGGLGATARPPRAAAPPGRRRSRRRDHVAGASAGPGPHQHHHVPPRQPRARGLRDQEHGDRPLRGRRRRRLPEDRPRARLHDGARGHRRDQEHGVRTREGRRRPGADLPRPDGHGHGGDLSDHGRPQAPVVRQARRRVDGRALLGRLHGRLRRARRARGVGRRPHREADRGRPGPHRDRPEPARGLDRPGRPRRPRVVPCGGRPRSRRSVPRPDLAPDPDLPPDTRLWASLQAVGGGTWGGCVYDVDAIQEVLRLGARAAR